MVDDAGDAGCRPREVLGLGALGPGVHVALEGDLAAGSGGDVRALGLEQRVAEQGSVDRGLDPDGGHAGFDRHEVVDVGDAAQVANRAVGCLALVLPGHLTCEVHDVVGHVGLDRSVGNVDRSIEGLPRLSRDVRVVRVRPHRLNGHLIGDRGDATHALCRLHGQVAFGVASDLARERHCTVVDADADVRRGDVGGPLELGVCPVQGLGHTFTRRTDDGRSPGDATSRLPKSFTRVYFSRLGHDQFRTRPRLIPTRPGVEARVGSARNAPHQWSCG